jgi:putative ABC transport system permease protein
MEAPNYTLVNISYIDLLIGLGLIFVAIGMSRWQRLMLEREFAIGALRTLIQLVAIGYILKYIFALDKWYVILVTISVMIVIAAITVSRRQVKQTKELP